MESRRRRERKRPVDCLGFVSVPLHTTRSKILVWIINGHGGLCSGRQPSAFNNGSSIVCLKWLIRFIYCFSEDTVNTFLRVTHFCEGRFHLVLVQNTVCLHGCLPPAHPPPPLPQPHTLYIHIDRHASRAKIDFALWQRPVEITRDGRRHHDSRLSRACFLKWRVVTLCSLLPPRYDATLPAIDGGPFYLQVSYLMKAVHSFTAGGAGGLLGGEEKTNQ